MEAIKRYLLFGGDFYYPAGGWDDFIGSYDSQDDARNHVEKGYKRSSDITDKRPFVLDWYHCVDLITGSEVWHCYLNRGEMKFEASDADV